MKKVKHTLGDGTVEWVWEKKFDGCVYGFNCRMWTKEQAKKDFKEQIRFQERRKLRVELLKLKTLVITRQ